MLICDIKKGKYVRAADNCILCELLHPQNLRGQVAMNYSLAHAIVPAGETTLPHRLKTSSEVYYILSGEGVMYIEDDTSDVRPGQVVYIAPGSVQYIKNTGQDDLIFLAIVDPMWRSEDEDEDVLLSDGQDTGE